LPLASYFSGLKLRWLLDHVPDARDGDLAFGTMDAWLMWHLAGLHVTDVTNASRTQLMNISTLDWDHSLLTEFGIPRSVLPRIVTSSAVYGPARGVLEGTVIAGILGDQQAALMGQACFEPGEAKNTYGTGCFLLMHTGTVATPSKHGLVTTVAAKLGDAPATYALEGSIAVAGAVVQWLRDNLRIIRSSSEIEALANSVPDNGDVYFVPAFSGLYAPHWRADARGIIAGLTQFATAGHVARAALEAVAYQTMDVVRAMEQDSGIAMRSLRVDGGMIVNQTLMRFQADMLNVPLVRPRVLETTALGAAYASGLAVGYWNGLDDLRANWEVAETWEPAMNTGHRDTLARSWSKAVERSMGWT
jgi:glycerol kinase